REDPAVSGVRHQKRQPPDLCERGGAESRSCAGARAISRRRPRPGKSFHPAEKRRCQCFGGTDAGRKSACQPKRSTQQQEIGGPVQVIIPPGVIGGAYKVRATIYSPKQSMIDHNIGPSAKRGPVLPGPSAGKEPMLRISIPYVYNLGVQLQKL